MKITAVLLLIVAHVSAQDANCDFYQSVQAGQTYYVYNPNYPQNYSGGVTCRWIAECPVGYNCRLDCTEIAIPQTPSCSMDRLLISKSGDPQLYGADPYCGRGSVTAVSTNRRISVGLITSRNSPGGRFFCRLSAQQSSITPPPTCRCGYKKTSRIVGGVETGVNEFPSMAGIVDASISQIKCGGIIIDNRYVLTAAHCLVNQRVDNIAVVVGEHDVTIGDSPATQGIRAARFIIHPQYTPSTYDYDIAIIVLQKDIVFSDYVGPICLPFKFTNTDFTGKSVTLLGWGTTFPGGPSSNVLQKVDVKVISQSDCRRSTSYVTDRQVCTYTPGKDACQDDSGGPALYTDPATGLLFNVGIISHGQFCASGTPGINTRVTALLDWIVLNAPALYCRK